MLSRFSRILTYFTALLYFVTGLILFILPARIAPVFAWKVTPFMTMTIGGWCLGNAWLAWMCARRWKWAVVYTSLTYLWLFGLIQTLVVVMFADKLALANPIAWLYLLTLGVNVLTAVVGLIDWTRLRPHREDLGARVGIFSRIATIAFVLFVGFLSVYGMLVENGSFGTNGGIFPEVMTPFTLRAFGGFYLALTLAVIPLLTERNIVTFLHHSIASYGLILAITAAAFVYIGLFDLANHPTRLLYIGAYLLVGIPLLFVFLRLGTGAGKKSVSKEAPLGERST